MEGNIWKHPNERIKPLFQPFNLIDVFLGELLNILFKCYVRFVVEHLLREEKNKSLNFRLQGMARSSCTRRTFGACQARERPFQSKSTKEIVYKQISWIRVLAQQSCHERKHILPQPPPGSWWKDRPHASNITFMTEEEQEKVYYIRITRKGRGKSNHSLVAELIEHFWAWKSLPTEMKIIFYQNHMIQHLQTRNGIISSWESHVQKILLIDPKTWKLSSFK